MGRKKKEILALRDAIADLHFQDHVACRRPVIEGAVKKAS
jgi:hypothetical protein